MKRRYSPGRMNRIERAEKRKHYKMLMDSFDIILGLQRRELDLFQDVRRLTGECINHAVAVAQGGFLKKDDSGEVQSYRNERFAAEFVFNRGAFPLSFMGSKYGIQFISNELAECLAKQIEKRMAEDK